MTTVLHLSKLQLSLIVGVPCAVVALVALVGIYSCWRTCRRTVTSDRRIVYNSYFSCTVFAIGFMIGPIVVIIVGFHPAFRGSNPREEIIFADWIFIRNLFPRKTHMDDCRRPVAKKFDAPTRACFGCLMAIGGGVISASGVGDPRFLFTMAWNAIFSRRGGVP